ncbi:homogentisate phytyltransferase 1, chloroplastic [Carica papaya]|uniref:homogentisate phytyltransferase 1, chloroplastic n=1 Tax=Carica papaya TaxID=3649 RepID=UPI000B8C7BDB|nr:homogentisate phytyltransferase 1, chloroplastic [Carica papaya]
MESLAYGSFPKSCLITSGGNFWGCNKFKARNFSSSNVGVQVSKCRSCSILQRYYAVRFQQNFKKQHDRGFEERSTLCLKNKTKFAVNATSSHSLESEPESHSSKSTWRSISNILDAFYRFSRPHTVIGTALSIISVSLLAVEKLSDISPLFLAGVLEAVVAAFMMNIYIVGLNQLYDIEIDKVNKPYLPLASGEYSVQTGILIITLASLMSFFIGWIVGSWPLFWALFISFILGTAYSINLPLLRWKRFALVAAMCILAVRAVIVQLAFYLHIQLWRNRIDLYSHHELPLQLRIIFKQKDLNHCLQKLGADCMADVESCFSPDVQVSKCSIQITIHFFFALVQMLGHAILASILWGRAKSVNLKSKAAITSCYMFIWQLFYAEYMLIPFVR